MQNDAPLKIYYAGDLFDAKHLIGNVLIGSAINRISNGRYLSDLPQDSEVQQQRGKAIRDSDLWRLIGADVALFNFDGTDLDSGTVVEFVYAKAADIPSVIIRTDFRAAGDAEDVPWNLMAGYYPRTENLLLHAMEIYRDALGDDPVGTPAATERYATLIAEKVVPALDRVVAMPPILPAEDAEAVYKWLAMMPGYEVGDEEAMRQTAGLLRHKRERKLLS